MSYESFCNIVQKIADKFGQSVRFSHDDGKHLAILDDGTRFSGNTVARGFSVKWGSDHEKFATVSQMVAAGL